MNTLFAGRNLKDGEWLEKYVDSVIKRLHNKFDLVIIITGEVRVGKSTLGLFFLDQFYKKIGQELDLDRYIAYASDEIEDKIFDLPTFTAMQIDETQESFDYSQHMSKDQYKMRVTFTTMGFKYRWIIVCGPDMMDIGLHFRKRASMWFHVLERDKKYNKHYLAFKKIGDPLHRSDPWGFDKIKKTKPAKTVKALVRKLKKLESFAWEGICPPVNNKLVKKYEKLSEKKKQEFRQRQQERELSKTNCPRCYEYLRDDCNMPYKDISAMRGGKSQAAIKMALSRYREKQVT